jgi:hypothetical protein
MQISLRNLDSCLDPQALHMRFCPPSTTSVVVIHSTVLDRYIVKFFKGSVRKTTKRQGGGHACAQLFNRQVKDDQCRDRKDAHRNADYL